MHNITLFSGSSHPQFTSRVTDILGIPLGKASLSKFSNNETNVEIKESVRNMNVFILQTGSKSDDFVELLIMIHACKIASASKITAVVPCFPYTNQPEEPCKTLDRNELTDHQLETLKKMEKPDNNYRVWATRSGNLIANMLTTAGADHIITMDLHEPQFVGFFNIPVDNLKPQPFIINYLRENVAWYKNAVIVTPDAGGTKRATSLAKNIGCSFAVIHRRKRLGSDGVYDMTLVGQVQGRECIIVDDMVKSAHTIVNAACLLKENGATQIFAIVTHGVFSGNALDQIQESHLDQIIVSTSMPQDENMRKSPKVKVFDVAPMFSEAIRRIHNGESVSMIFE